MGTITGKDAAYITPRLMPDDALLPRDNSGGPDYKPRSGDWDEGGKIKGEKGHLSVGGKGK